MDLFRAVNTCRFILLIVCIVLVASIAICGCPDILFFGMEGVFEKDSVRLGLDLAGGSIITYEAVPAEGEKVTSDGMKDVEEIMRYRLDNMGYTEANVYVLGDNLLRVEIPGIDNPTDAANTLGTTAKLQFVDYNGDVLIEGDMIKEATGLYGTIDESGEYKYYVSLNFTAEGKRAFEQATERISKLSDSSNRYLAIKLDDQTISQPTVSEKISGNAIISGSFTSMEEVKELASLINGGALTYDLLCDDTHGSLSSTGASLGERSLETSLIAGAIGLAIVLIFMIVIYRLPGVVSALCLIAYTAILGILLVKTKANLTLPGIAGIILSIGMAVDANVVIFERIKEEIRNGKSIKAAINAGFSNALSAVLDSNITTLIAAVVLWYLGSGSIQGFAVTLFLGVCVSMLTSVILTKVFLKLLSNTTLTKLSFYGVKERSVKE